MEARTAALRRPRSRTLSSLQRPLARVSRWRKTCLSRGANRYLLVVSVSRFRRVSMVIPRSAAVENPAETTRSKRQDPLLAPGSARTATDGTGSSRPSSNIYLFLLYITSSTTSALSPSFPLHNRSLPFLTTRQQQACPLPLNSSLLTADEKQKPLANDKLLATHAGPLYVLQATTLSRDVRADHD